MGKKILLSFVILLIFGIIAGGLFLFTSQNPNLLTSPLQPSPTVPPATPTTSTIIRDQEQIEKAVNSFYARYTDCLKKPPLEAKRPYAKYCQEKSTGISESFPETLKPVRGMDPILCSVSVPNSVTYESVDFESPDRAITTMVELFGGFAKKISVILVRELNEWKIDSISCAIP